MNTSKEKQFIATVLEKCIDKDTWAYNAPTRKTLILLLKWMEKNLGIVTRNKTQEQIKQEIYSFIDTLEYKIRKQLHELFVMFSHAYPQLREESLQEENNELQAKMQAKITENQQLMEKTHREWNKERSTKLKQSQAEKRLWAKWQKDKEQYFAVADIIDDHFESWKIKETIHKGHRATTIKWLSLSNGHTNYAIRKKAVQVPKDGSWWKANEERTTYWDWRIKIHYMSQMDISEDDFSEKTEDVDLIFRWTISKETEKIESLLREIYNQWYRIEEWTIDREYESLHKEVMKQLLPSKLHDEKFLVWWLSYMADTPMYFWYMSPWDVRIDEDWIFESICCGKYLPRMYCIAARHTCRWTDSACDSEFMAFLPSDSR